MEVYHTFALLDCVRYNGDFVKLGFCSIHSPVILARQKKIVRYTEHFVIERFVISRFHCTMTHKKIYHLVKRFRRIADCLNDFVNCLLIRTLK